MRLSALHLTAAVLFVGLAAATVPAAATAAETGNVSVYQTDAELNDSVAIEAAIDDGTAEPADKVVTGETLVVAIHSERFADDVDDRDGPPTVRFFATLDDEADFEIIQTNPTTMRAPKAILLGPDNTTAHRAGNTTYAVVDTEAAGAIFRNSDDQPADIRDSDRFAATFGYNLSENPSEGPEFEMFTTEAEFSSFSAYVYDPLPPEVIYRSVDASIAPEKELFARLVLEDGRTLTDEVDRDDGSVTLNLRHVEPETEYTLELVHDGKVVDAYDGTIREPKASLEDAYVTTLNNRTVVNITAELSHGGEVRIFDEDGEELGSSRVTPGESTQLSVSLRGEQAEELRVRAARERGAAAEFYESDDAETTLDFDGEIHSPTPAVTPETPATPTETPATPTETPTTPTETPVTSPGAEDQPGFGVVVAIIALTVAGLLAVRHRPTL